MQLLIQTAAPTYAAWKADFDAGREAFANAGLSVLQIWQAEDGKIVLLLSYAARKRAEEWLANQRATGQAYDAQFLQTATS